MVPEPNASARAGERSASRLENMLTIELGVFDSPNTCTNALSKKEGRIHESVEQPRQPD